MKKKTLVVCSGGLDSVTLAYQVAIEQNLMGLLTFDYGQRHKKEIQYATLAATRLGVLHRILDIANIGGLLSSSLTDNSIDVPEGHYAANNMAATVVPNRNAIMLTIAFGLADSVGAEAVAIAVHGGDHFIYPDCRPAFIQAFTDMQKLALGKIPAIGLYSPYLKISKGDIVKQSLNYNVPIHETWSCYNGDAVHCGRCGTCVERLEAIDFAGALDDTAYADKTFWKTALAQHQTTEEK
ncbi:MAG: 7-cyano-7-deazaguanine synthase QueC [Ostreibacterium sp.]